MILPDIICRLRDCVLNDRSHVNQIAVSGKERRARCARRFGGQANHPNRDAFHFPRLDPFNAVDPPRETDVCTGLARFGQKASASAHQDNLVGLHEIHSA
jgi:hypothetical protein